MLELAPRQEEVIYVLGVIDKHTATDHKDMMVTLFDVAHALYDFSGELSVSDDGKIVRLIVSSEAMSIDASDMKQLFERLIRRYDTGDIFHDVKFFVRYGFWSESYWFKLYPKRGVIVNNLAHDRARRVHSRQRRLNLRICDYGKTLRMHFDRRCSLDKVIREIVDSACMMSMLPVGCDAQDYCLWSSYGKLNDLRELMDEETYLLARGDGVRLKPSRTVMFPDSDSEYLGYSSDDTTC